MSLEPRVIIEGPHALSLLDLAIKVVTRKVVHAVVLVQENVGRDRVVDELDHEIDGVLGWPVESLVVSDVPLISAIPRSEEERFVDIGHFFHKFPRSFKRYVEVVW